MKRVVFLSAPNSPQSLIAEALLRHIDSRNFEALRASAGLDAAHPLSIEVMKEIGVEVGQKGHRSVDELRGQKVDFVVTLDEATSAQNCPIAATDVVHWKFENPLNDASDVESQRRRFRVIRDQIAQRLRLFAIVHSRPSSPAQPARAALAGSMQ